MNEETFTVRYKFDDLHASRLTSALTREDRLYRLVPWLGVLLLVVWGYAAWMWTSHSAFFEQTGIPLTPIFGIGLLFFPRGMRGAMRKIFKQSSIYGRETTVKINREQVFSEIVGISRNEFSWSLITRVVEAPDYFVLRNDKTVLHLLPFDGFEDDSKVAAFRDLLKSRVAEYKCRK